MNTIQRTQSLSLKELLRPGCTIGPPQHSDEWHALRSLDPGRNPQFVIGASDAATVLGVNPYKTPLRLYYEIQGLVDRDPPNLAMKRGTLLEPVVMQIWVEESGQGVVECLPMLMSIEYPYIAASIDGVTDDGQAIVEIKTTTKAMYRPESWDHLDGPPKYFGDHDDHIPYNYYLQVQQQMLVSGIQVAYLAVMFDPRTVKFYRIEGSMAVQEEIKEALTKFYIDTINNQEPVIEPHPALKSDVAGIFPVEEKKEVYLSDAAAEAYQKYEQLSLDAARISAEMDALKAVIVAEAKDASTAHIPGTGMALRRTEVEESFWTDEDVRKAARKCGTVKRKGYVRTTFVKS